MFHILKLFTLIILMSACTPLANKFDMTYSGDVHDNDGKITEDFGVKIDDEAHSRS